MDNQSEKPSLIRYGAKIMNSCFHKDYHKFGCTKTNKNDNTYDKRGIYVEVCPLGASLIGFFIFTQNTKQCITKKWKKKQINGFIQLVTSCILTKYHVPKKDLTTRNIIYHILDLARLPNRHNPQAL